MIVPTPTDGSRLRRLPRPPFCGRTSGQAPHIQAGIVQPAAEAGQPGHRQEVRERAAVTLARSAELMTTLLPRPEFVDPRVVASGEGRDVTRVTTNGWVKVGRRRSRGSPIFYYSTRLVPPLLGDLLRHQQGSEAPGLRVHPSQPAVGAWRRRRRRPPGKAGDPQPRPRGRHRSGV